MMVGRIFRCLRCFRLKCQPAQTIMGDLPSSRVNKSCRPFVSVGVDFAGHFNMKSSKLRNAKILKVYLCIFVCFTTKAVHLEVVSDLTTEAFLAALKRFVARRGLPKEICFSWTRLSGACSRIKNEHRCLQANSEGTRTCSGDFHSDLGKVRRERDDTITLKSGNLLYYREFLVHRSLINNIITIGSVSSRVAYLILRVSKSFQLELSNRFECLQSCQSVDEINNRSLRRDIRNFNTNCIEEAIERNKGSKVFARDVSVGQSQLTKLKTVDGNIASTKAEVLREIANFYGQLYTSVAIPVSSSAVDPKAKLTRHFTEGIPDISLYEIRIALKQHKNNKAPGEDRNTSELLQAGGTPVLKVLQKLFNFVLLEGITPEAWNRSVVVLFFKKGENTLLKNYRPISLLSYVYKLFSRDITNRLARRFDDFQPPEQAGFRKGFSTIDHIHTLWQVIQKTEEYNLPLCLAFVDYEKASDSIETWAVQG
ncbi:hypothetical protein ABMA28_015317 [Loxostege sticticalis]|uniref:Reverse transcriptase domain-containing protein n=1 Tax=Loxostege sticticalis TaxID=481309 RepID=A0ABD0T9E1_LOXSC